MSAFHYRLLPVLAASLLLLAGCGTLPASDDAAASAHNAAPGQRAAAGDPDDMDTAATIWTVFGFNKEHDHPPSAPVVGKDVNPVLWQAAHDTLDFVKLSSNDPMTGEIVTDWYSPKDQPNVRYRVDVFVLSRALDSDSVAVTVQREARGPDGTWQKTTVTRDVGEAIDSAILRRAGEIRQAHQPQS
jgi:hypothetical protein